jgi:hypothetical protein
MSVDPDDPDVPYRYRFCQWTATGERCGTLVGEGHKNGLGARMGVCCDDASCWPCDDANPAYWLLTCPTGGNTGGIAYANAWVYACNRYGQPPTCAAQGDGSFRLHDPEPPIELWPTALAGWSGVVAEHGGATWHAFSPPQGRKGPPPETRPLVQCDGQPPRPAIPPPPATPVLCGWSPACFLPSDPTATFADRERVEALAPLQCHPRCRCVAPKSLLQRNEGAQIDTQGPCLERMCRSGIANLERVPDGMTVPVKEAPLLEVTCRDGLPNVVHRSPAHPKPCVGKPLDRAGPGKTGPGDLCAQNPGEFELRDGHVVVRYHVARPATALGVADGSLARPFVSVHEALTSPLRLRCSDVLYHRQVRSWLKANLERTVAIELVVHAPEPGHAPVDLAPAHGGRAVTQQDGAAEMAGHRCMVVVKGASLADRASPEEVPKQTCHRRVAGPALCPPWTDPQEPPPLPWNLPCLDRPLHECPKKPPFADVRDVWYAEGVPPEALYPSGCACRPDGVIGDGLVNVPVAVMRLDTAGPSRWRTQSITLRDVAGISVHGIDFVADGPYAAWRDRPQPMPAIDITGGPFRLEGHVTHLHVDGVRFLGRDQLRDWDAAWVAPPTEATPGTLRDAPLPRWLSGFTAFDVRGSTHDIAITKSSFCPPFANAWHQMRPSGGGDERGLSGGFTFSRNHVVSHGGKQVLLDGLRAPDRPRNDCDTKPESAFFFDRNRFEGGGPAPCWGQADGARALELGAVDDVRVIGNAFVGGILPLSFDLGGTHVPRKCGTGAMESPLRSRFARCAKVSGNTFTRTGPVRLGMTLGAYFGDNEFRDARPTEAGGRFAALVVGAQVGDLLVERNRLLGVQGRQIRGASDAGPDTIERTGIELSPQLANAPPGVQAPPAVVVKDNTIAGFHVGIAAIASTWEHGLSVDPAWLLVQWQDRSDAFVWLGSEQPAHRWTRAGRPLLPGLDKQVAAGAFDGLQPVLAQGNTIVPGPAPPPPLQSAFLRWRGPAELENVASSSNQFGISHPDRAANGLCDAATGQRIWPFQVAPSKYNGGHAVLAFDRLSSFQAWTSAEAQRSRLWPAPDVNSRYVAIDPQHVAAPYVGITGCAQPISADPSPNCPVPARFRSKDLPHCLAVACQDPRIPARSCRPPPP